MPVSRTRKKPAGRRPARPGRGPAGAQAGERGRAPVRWGAVVLAVLLVCALAIGVLSTLGGSRGGADEGAQDAEASAPAADPSLAALARRDADDPLAVGEADAPVVMIEYADFQCAFCGIYARDTYPRLLEEYVDAGKLRIEFRNFPIYGPESDAAARASWAAGQQGRFQEFYRVAFGEEFHQNSGRFEEDNLRRLAEQAGVADLDRFAADMESSAADEAVGGDAQEALNVGVTTPPLFLVNGRPLQGAQQLDKFEEAIDLALEEAQGAG
ncbi:DsbA family protein [Streptomyces hoynatensis]|uniref:DsbA family protein n=1 Tax=Streptomyces hoynatensis TaxID=1141874 RepID=A0A3A9ZEV9_9ACTN|nr:DsbA family protein [Streptomyces hoynatensis]RKN46833.1 DsbA family protein [Streptomyces hoynatensis]